MQGLGYEVDVIRVRVTPDSDGAEEGADPAVVAFGA